MHTNAEQVIDEINQKITPYSLPEELHKEVNIAVSEILKLKHDHIFEAESLVEEVADIVELMRHKTKYKFIWGKHSIISTMLASETPDIDIVTPIDLDSTLNLILPKWEWVDRVIFEQCDFALKRLFASSLIGMWRPSNLVLLKEDGTKESFQNQDIRFLRMVRLS